MNSEPEECLSAHELVAYVDGKLPVDRKAEIDRHFDECRLCAASVEGVARLESSEEYLRSAHSILAHVRTRTATVAMPAIAARKSSSRYWSARQYLALAATLVAGVGAALYLGRPGQSESLFQRYFEPYPSTQPIIRGSAGTDSSSDALALYEARNYRDALVAFEDILKGQPNNAVVHFYTGLCRLALGKSVEAIRDLEQVRQLGANEFEAPTEWYLALAHLRSQNAAEARLRLKRIAARGGFYEDRARALLAELDRLDRD
jgi:tetratricopeptide (TPR) repeat protein